MSNKDFKRFKDIINRYKKGDVSVIKLMNYELVQVEKTLKSKINTIIQKNGYETYSLKGYKTTEDILIIIKFELEGNSFNSIIFLPQGS